MDGKLKLVLASPKVHLANPKENAREIISHIDAAVKAGADVVAFPELSVTGYTCGDLFFGETLINLAKDALLEIEAATKDRDIIVVVGVPLKHQRKLYNCAVVIKDAQVLETFNKRSCDDRHGLMESRYFTCEPYEKKTELVKLSDDFLGPNMGVVIGDDVIDFSADLVVNIASGYELVGTHKKRLDSITQLSNNCGYGYVSAGEGESSTDINFSGLSAIALLGKMLGTSSVRTENKPAVDGAATSDEATASAEKPAGSLRLLSAELDIKLAVDARLSYRKVDTERGDDFELASMPYIPKGDMVSHLERAFDLQARGLATRLSAIGCKKVVLGISGGLDSTLALLVSKKAFEILGYDVTDITCVTMPCFGTSSATHELALKLMNKLGVTMREVDIKKSVLAHFRDIGHDKKIKNATYENAQARERTQVLMDIANDIGAIVVGTGDMSEMALGWCTYGGDQMSMYCVNAGVPKTLVRNITECISQTTDDAELAEILKAVLTVPISPELLPTNKKGDIAQKTEDIIGPYEIHDFVLYYMLACGYGPGKIYSLAISAFRYRYDAEVIKTAMQTFYKRFFASQFKRSASPDGPQILDISLSPRGGLFMPSDVCGKIWIEEAESL